MNRVEPNDPIIERYERNPILTKHDVPYPVETVHNAGVVRHAGKYVMLFRSHLRNGRSIIGLAESTDGFRFAVRPKPFLTPARAEPFASYEEYGVEDPRICPMEDKYLITYSVYSRHGVRVALAQTRDFTRRAGRLDHRGGPPQCGHLPRKVQWSLCPPGPTPFRHFAVVHLGFLLAGPGALGRGRGRHQTHGLSLGRDESRAGSYAHQD